MEKQIRNVLKIWVCSILISGCTIGPVIETRAIVVKSGTPIEVLEQIKVKARILTDTNGEIDVFKQDIGGWITMHPDHWISLKKEIERLRKKCDE